jgi:hypothetical protein
MVHYLQQEISRPSQRSSREVVLVLQARDEKIGLILVIILRGTAREEFKEFDESKEFKETNRSFFFAGNRLDRYGNRTAGDPLLISCNSANSLNSYSSAVLA